MNDEELNENLKNANKRLEMLEDSVVFLWIWNIAMLVSFVIHLLL